MKIIIVCLFALLMLCILYAFSLKGRSGHTDWKGFKGFCFAHRGLHNGTTAPENSMEAFRRAKEKGYGIECDVHLLADGNLAVIHDSSLLRTAGVDLQIENLTTADLKNYFLEGTAEKIPTFSQVLSLINGEVPLIIEIKTHNNNFAEISRRVSEQLEVYNGDYCVESFDPKCVYWFAKNKPEIIRGQLSQNYFKLKKSKMRMPAKFFMSELSTNVFTKPDFVAYRFAHRNNLSYTLCRKLWNVQGVGWTITNEQDIIAAKNENILPIFEKINP